MNIFNGSGARFLCVFGLCLCAFLGVNVNEAKAAGSTSFYYPFSWDGVLEETGSMSESSSKYFWLNSGGRLPIKNGTASTILGSLTAKDPWRLLYSANNAVDTDNGSHPQNLFRLVTRSTWENVRSEAYFKITKHHFSQSPNRNASNGLLLMSRYQDSGQTLYYAGLRVDGTAVIKKKLRGAYTTLAQKALYAGKYDRESEPTLIPGNKWIGLKSETLTNADGSVTIKLFTDIGKTGKWKQVLTVVDKSSPIKSAGYAGLRTDFMDVLFDDLKLVELA